jgi:hypothetical protein
MPAWFKYEAKMTKSFDSLLLAILLVICLGQMQHGLHLGAMVYFFIAAVALLIIRWVVGAKSMSEAFSWLCLHKRIAFYFLFICVGNFVFMVYVSSGGYFDLFWATGVYFFVTAVFSALLLLSDIVIKFILKALGRVIKH